MNLMKNIDKIVFFAMAAVMAACTEMPQADVDMEPQEDLIHMEFTANVDSDDVVVKTTYSGRKVYWEENDAVSIFFERDGITRQPFTVSSRSEDKRQVKLVGNGVQGASSYVAVYPHLEANAYDGNTLTVTVPPAQTAVANSFASEANVSVAYSTDKAGELNFRNACALLAFRFETEEDARKTASVTIRAKTDTEGVYHGITGNVKVNVQQSEAGFMPVVEGEGTADHVTVYAPSGGFKYNSENPVTYYAVICPGVYEHGFEIIVTSGYSEGSDIADFPVAMDRVSGPLERNALFSMGALANPFDILPEEIVISLDFANEENLNPLGTFPIMAQQSADGDDYTYKYTYEHEGKTFTEPLTFTIYKGSGYSYTYLNGAATGTDKYFYVLNSGANTCMKFPAIRGRYLKSVSFSHTGTTYNRNFRLQEGYPTAGHYYTVGAVPEAADAVGTAVVTFPTGVEDTAQLNVTKAGVPYFVQFTSASKYSITNITMVYTKDGPVAEQ